MTTIDDVMQTLRETSPLLSERPIPESWNAGTDTEGNLFPESGMELKGRWTLPFTTLSEAVRHAPPEPEWLWEGLLTVGAITLLGGKPKDGKTTLTFGLLAALEAGVPFLGFPTQQAKALILTEERPTTLAEKRERWGVDPLLLMRHSIGDKSWPEVCEEAVHVAHANGAKVLIVDTLAEWTALGGESENASGAVIEQLRPLHNAAASGLAVLAIHHLRKGNGDGWDSFRGSGAFQAAVDILARLTRKGDSFRELHAEGRFAALPRTVLVALEESGFEVVDAVSERDRIVEALERAGSATKEQLAEDVELTARAVHNHLAALYSEEKIDRTGGGKKGDPFVFHADAGFGKGATPLGDSSIPELPFEEAA